jgi:hypothetical protein
MPVRDSASGCKDLRRTLPAIAILIATHPPPPPSLALTKLVDAISLGRPRANPSHAGIIGNCVCLGIVGCGFLRVERGRKINGAETIYRFRIIKKSLR